MLNTNAHRYPSMAVRPEDVCLYDPLIKPLLRITGGNGYLTAVLAILGYLFLAVIPGLLLSTHFNKLGIPVISITKPQELLVSLVVYFIGAPTNLAFYVMGPVHSAELFVKLAKNSVIGSSNSSGESPEEFVKSELSKWSNVKGLIVVLGLSAFLSFIFLSSVFASNNMDKFWWGNNKYYFWLVWAPLCISNTYFIFWVIYRRIVTVNVIDKLLDKFEIHPILFHPDNVNGMLPIGEYILRISPLLTVAGFWLIVMSLTPVIYKLGSYQPLRLSPDVIVDIIIYIISAPVIILPPAWKTHRVMLQAKENSLFKIGLEIQNLRSNVNMQGNQMQRQANYSVYEGIVNLAAIMTFIISKVYSAFTQSNGESNSFSHLQSRASFAKSYEFIEMLEKEYHTIEKYQKTWPFNLPSIRRFSINFFTPIVTIVLGVAANWLTYYVGIGR